MWTRERWLTIAELCGFAAVASGAAVAAYAIAGAFAGVSVGLLVSGAEAIYLANAYALPALAAKPLPAEQILTLKDDWKKSYVGTPEQPDA